MLMSYDETIRLVSFSSRIEKLTDFIYSQVFADGNFDKYPKCDEYAKEIEAIPLDEHKTELYTPAINGLFAKLRAYYGPSITASARKYTAQLEAAIAAPNPKVHRAHSAVDGSASFAVAHYKNALVAVAKQLEAANREIDDKEKYYIKFAIKDMRIIQSLADNPSSKASLTEEILVDLKENCNAVNSPLWVVVAVNDHRMASIVQATGLRVQNYFDTEISIAADTGRVKLEELIVQPRWKDLWYRFTTAPIKDGTAQGLTDGEYRAIYSQIAARGVCTASVAASIEMLNGLKTAYLNIQFRKQRMPNEPKKAAALTESWNLMMNDIKKARELRKFAECMVDIERYLPKRKNPTDFQIHYDTSYGSEAQFSRSRGETAFKSMLLVNYIISL